MEPIEFTAESLQRELDRAQAEVEKFDKKELAALLLLVGPFRWDARLGMFYYGDERVSPVVVRDWLDRFLQAYSQHVKDDIWSNITAPVSVLRGKLKDALCVSSLTALAVAIGGWDNVTEASLRLVEESMREQAYRWESLLEGLGDDDVKRDRRVGARVAGYVLGMRYLFEKAKEEMFLSRNPVSREAREAAAVARAAALQAAELRRAGREYKDAEAQAMALSLAVQTDAMERNLLGIADHCAGCIIETKRGWVPYGTLIPLGQRDCKAGCRCTIIYKVNRR